MKIGGKQVNLQAAFIGSLYLLATTIVICLTVIIIDSTIKEVKKKRGKDSGNNR